MSAPPQLNLAQVVKAGEPVELRLRMQCLKRGTPSPVLVHVGHGGGKAYIPDYTCT